MQIYELKLKPQNIAKENLTASVNFPNGRIGGKTGITTCFGTKSPQNLPQPAPAGNTAAKGQGKEGQRTGITVYRIMDTTGRMKAQAAHTAHKSGYQCLLYQHTTHDKIPPVSWPCHGSA